ncbi:H/ACA ribonucleoprotein complex subunit 3-like [Oryx dammah]|uniref:H/ACA ribonucleoprotein complex subunit 3-like n=1 Tax=Oryx dammah TaxID=59534 RepID=UPI001A9AAC50|nr:H/ACA ribonucleoprotein complex subunit 3-like [Oryx dammah]
MFLQYYYSGQGDQIYTLKKPDSMGQQSRWTYPAQFSLDNKYSQDEITIKKCFKVFMTQQPRPVL